MIVFSKKTNSDIPWVEKHRPRSVKEMALPSTRISGQKVKLDEELRNFIQNFFIEIKRINEENKKVRLFNRTHEEKERKEELQISPEKAAVLLEGPPGIGKTSIVYALANDLNMEVVETNASDTRTKDKLEAKLKETVKSRGIMDFIVQSREKIILIDEVDGIYGVSDRGAVPTILNIIQNTQFPIILCSNEYKQSLQPLYNKIRKFELKALSDEEILRIVKTILRKEKITSLNANDLNLIIGKNNGDLRGVINDLQGIGQGVLDENVKELIFKLNRDSTEEIFSLIRDLFQKVTTLREARDLTDKSDVDYNFLYKWVNENLPTFIRINKELANAYENLSIADEIFGRIRKNQYWSLLPYFYDLFAGGVPLSRKGRVSTEGFRRVIFPRYITTGIFSLSSNEKSLIEKVKEKYDISDIEAIQDFIPFLRILCGKSRKKFKELSEWLELDANEKKVLK
ncbi:MAG: replication factor C large subunit [Candidatus Heimdallarchaeota archaeon]